MKNSAYTHNGSFRRSFFGLVKAIFMCAAYGALLGRHYFQNIFMGRAAYRMRRSFRAALPFPFCRNSAVADKIM